MSDLDDARRLERDILDTDAAWWRVEVPAPKSAAEIGHAFQEQAWLNDERNAWSNWKTVVEIELKRAREQSTWAEWWDDATERLSARRVELDGWRARLATAAARMGTTATPHGVPEAPKPEKPGLFSDVGGLLKSAAVVGGVVLAGSVFLNRKKG